MELQGQRDDRGSGVQRRPEQDGGRAGFTAPDINRVQSNIYCATTGPVPLLEPPPSGWKGCVFNRYIDDGTDDDDGDIRDGPFSGGGRLTASGRRCCRATILEMGLQNGQACMDQVAFGLSITIRTKGEYT